MTESMVFLDCEFTSLEQPKLLSLGLWPLDATEASQVAQGFYGELGGEAVTKLFSRMNNFTHDTVLPQLGICGAAYASEAALGQALAAFLRQQPNQIHVGYDYHADFDLLEGALKSAGAWDELEARLVPTHVGYLHGEKSSEAASDAAWKAFFAVHYVDRHHAMADAFALRAAFKAMHG
jgi:hypothetical protein